MNLIQAIILGLIQGLTEFLPVSSSGHLVLGQVILGVDQGAKHGIGVAFEVFVHFRHRTFLYMKEYRFEFLS